MVRDENVAVAGARGVGNAPVGESAVLDGEILARGVPIGSLIGGMSFVEMIFFQAQGRRPSDAERTVMEAYLVSLCEHGVTSPSTHGARVAASVRAPFAASAVSFIAGAMGSYHFGALERAMEQVREVVRWVDGGGSVGGYVEARLAAGARLWGFGHRFHKSVDRAGLSEGELARMQELTDPRVRRLLEIADGLGWPGRHLTLVRELGHALHERKGTPINIDGCGAGFLLDMGFGSGTALLFVVLGRLPNIARLWEEEQGNPINRFVALADRSDPTFDRTVDREQ